MAQQRQFFLLIAALLYYYCLTTVLKVQRPAEGFLTLQGDNGGYKNSRDPSAIISAATTSSVLRLVLYRVGCTWCFKISTIPWVFLATRTPVTYVSVDSAEDLSLVSDCLIDRIIGRDEMTRRSTKLTVSNEAHNIYHSGRAETCTVSCSLVVLQQFHDSRAQSVPSTVRVRTVV